MNKGHTRAGRQNTDNKQLLGSTFAKISKIPDKFLNFAGQEYNPLMKKIAFAFLIMLAASALSAQKLSKHANISIITCGPGNQLYSAFGHTALRVKDPALRLDNVYNYGTFDFNTPNFYLKFARGKLDYMLSISRYKQFILSYKREKRWIKQQTLKLSRTEKQAVFEFLINNAKPENKYYRYDFFYDNCATRIRDLIEKTLTDSLKLGNTGLDSDASFRDMLHLYLTEKPWVKFGIDLIIGLPADKTVSRREAAFLPDYLFNVFADAQTAEPTGSRKLIAETKTIHLPYKKPHKSKTVFSPFILFSLIFLLIGIISFIEIRKKTRYKIIDILLFGIFGLAGVLISLLWFATDHSATANNMHLIWTLPTHLFAVFIIGSEKLRLLAKAYFTVFLLVFVLFAAFSPLFPQDIPLALIPLNLTLALRSFIILRSINRKL